MTKEWIAIRNWLLVFACALVGFPVFGKYTDYDYREKGSHKTVGDGHRGDIVRLFIGDRPGIPFEMGEVCTVIANYMFLVVDSTHTTTGEESEAVKSALYVLEQRERQEKYKLKSIPDVRAFLTPGSSAHGIYTHLGWNHTYGIDYKYREDVNDRWRRRKELCLDMLDNLFGFSPIENPLEFLNKERDSLGALFYYVHILGDHEIDSKRSNYTRIPIQNLNEAAWDSTPGWQPVTTIVQELDRHLRILFADQKDSPDYTNLLDKINGYLDVGTQAIPNEDIAVNKKAKDLLGILIRYCPALLQKASFAKKFYEKYNH